MPLYSFNTVLLVDDNERNRQASAKHLKRAGYEIWECSTGAEALQLARKFPSIIVLDMSLPDMSGLDVCTKLKSDPDTAPIPILYTSAAIVRSDDRVRGLESGADGYLVAPIQPEELVATVRALLRTRKAEVAASKLALQWESTFDAISDGICVVATSGVIERCNPAFSKILQIPSGQIVGKTIRELPDSAFLRELIKLPIHTSHQKEVAEIKADNAWFRISADPLWSPDKRFSGVVYFVTDITERKETEIALASANEKIRRHAEELEETVNQRTEELQRTIRSLDTFCYTIAHDLKSPLRSIKGFTSILRDDYSKHFDAEGLDYTRRIVESVERMNRLIDDLLDYGRLSNMELPIEEVDIQETVQFVLNELWADTRARDAAIRIQEPLHMVRANSTVMRQVMANLLSNAIKFVKPGTQPSISISTESNNGHVRINVQDNGIGIESRYFNRIFDVFERLHGKDSEYPGTGIGLAIVRKGVERMGGTVGLESKPGKGSRFWLELPSAISKSVGK